MKEYTNEQRMVLEKTIAMFKNFSKTDVDNIDAYNIALGAYSQCLEFCSMFEVFEEAIKEIDAMIFWK